jgi:two-component system, LytTR family, response regulator
MTIRTVIVDDEPLARRRIRRYLREHADVDVVGECGDGETAFATIRDQAPELLFLDVQMPELDGFALLRALRLHRPPAVVFTTAFDEHAVRAFEVNALDYLVKPIARDRFNESLTRARAALAAGPNKTFNARAASALAAVTSQEKPLARLVVRRNGRSIFVNTQDVRWIEADRNHVRLHIGAEHFTHAESISRLEERLDAARFVRVHRSAIVNVEWIAEMQPWFRGDAVLILRDGTRVTLSRTHRAKLAALVGQTL